MVIYKLLGAGEWAAARAVGRFDGSAVDLADGYIHFSTHEQVAETAARYFADQRDVVLLAIDADRLGDGLRWEPSRGGALFPHLYASLGTETVVGEWQLPGEIPVDEAVTRALSRGSHEGSWME